MPKKEKNHESTKENTVTKATVSTKEQYSSDHNKTDKEESIVQQVEDKTDKVLHDVSERFHQVSDSAKKAAASFDSKKIADDTKNITSKIVQGLKENGHMILAAILLLIGIVILRDIIVKSLEIAIGIACIIIAYLLATDFFKKETQDVTKTKD